MTDWSRSEMYINAKLDELSQDLKDVKASLVHTNLGVARLQTQARMSGFIFGGIAGLVSALIAVFIEGWITKGK